MKENVGVAADQVYLGIEGGATRCVALAVNGAGAVLRRLETGPANLRLLTDAQLLQHLRLIKKATPRPVRLAIGLAGARTAADKTRISRAAQKVWPEVPCYATNDLETGLMAAQPAPGAAARVLVLSGTGSCCFGRNVRGQTAKVDGWGHLLGDKGSGYDIGLQALHAVLWHYDLAETWPPLGARLLRALQLNEPDDLIAWVQHAAKPEVAALAVEVFETADTGDRLALHIISLAVEGLVGSASACAGRLARPKSQVQFIPAGSILLKQTEFAQRVSRPGLHHPPASRDSRTAAP